MTTTDPGATAQLLRDVSRLSGELGERHDGSEVAYARLRAAADHVEESLTDAGFAVRRQAFAGTGRRPVENVEAERRGGRWPDEIVVIGAHYDSIRGGPGADDNATGVAALLATGRGLGRPPDRTVRIVAFTNEEHPHTRRRTMGSLVHARSCHDRGENVVAMLSLECLGFHAGARARQRRGDLTRLKRLVSLFTEGAFVVGNLRSRRLADSVADSLRRAGPLPIRRVVVPGFLPLAKSSDRWSYWKNGYPAVMITDAAPLRYRHYHRPTDTADRIDGEALAAMTDAIAAAVDALASGALQEASDAREAVATPAPRGDG